jgi:hypothetical protein
MKFEYRLTEREFLRHLRLIGVPVYGAWRAYGLVMLALLPSLILFTVFEERSSAMACQAMFAFMLLATVAAWLRKLGYPKRFPEAIELDENGLNHSWSHSRSQWNWSRIEQMEQRANEILFYSLGRPLLVPKRVFGDQRQAVKELLQRIRDRMGGNPSGDKSQDSQPSPVAIYRDLILSNKSTERYRYQVTESDLQRIQTERFQLLSSPFPLTISQSPNPVSAHRTTATSGWSGATIASLAAIAVLLPITLFFYFSADFPPRAIRVQKGSLSFLQTVGVWLLPLGIVWLWSKFRLRLRVRSIKQRPPSDESILILDPQGWVIANPNGGTLGSWHDLTHIVHSQHFFGLKMINQLVYLIPKWIFDSPEGAQRFLQQIIDYCHRSAHLPAAPQDPPQVNPVEIIETRNPYQSPQQ